MKNHRCTFAAFLWLSLNWQHVAIVSSSAGSIIISEIAGKGSSHACGDGSNDWIELHNTDPPGEQPTSLSGYILHDGKGIDDEQAFTFPQDYESLIPGEYRLICCTNASSTKSSPQFAIGGDDTLTLVASDGTTVISSVGPLPDTHHYFDITYAWDSETNGFQYTSTPTPGLPNVLTQVGETTAADQIKQRLARQNEQATRFFGMDSQGYPVQDDALDWIYT
jgi:Lamin Tail Domain